MGAGPGGLDRSMRGVADAVEDLLAGAEATVEQPPLIKGVDYGGVVSKVVGLAPHGPVPVQSQPGQILDNGGLELGLAAGRINVLDAQQEASADVARGAPCRQGGKGMASMKPAGRGRREPGDEGHGGPQTRRTAPAASASDRAARMSLSGRSSISAARSSIANCRSSIIQS